MTKHSEQIENALKAIEDDNIYQAIEWYNKALKTAPKHKKDDLICIISSLMNIAENEENNLRYKINEIYKEIEKSLKLK